MRALPFEIPIDPDADTARRWLEDELSKNVYREDGQSWLQSILEWVSRLFERVGDATGGLAVAGIPGSVVAAVLFVVLLAGLLYLVLGPIRRSRRTKTSATVFEDDDRSADAMSRAADDAAERGDWDTAVLERFRSIVRRAEGAGWVAVIPGMTAYEFVEEAGHAVAALATELLWAGDIFDRVRYGHSSGTAQAYERLLGLEQAVRGTRAPRVNA